MPGTSASRSCHPAPETRHTSQPTLEQPLVHARERGTDLDFKGEVFLQVFDDHDQKRKLYAQRLGWVCRASDEGGAAGVRQGAGTCCRQWTGPVSDLTLVPTISMTSDWMSLSVILLMCPLRTCTHTHTHTHRADTSDSTLYRAHHARQLPVFPRFAAACYRCCRGWRGIRTGTCS